MITMHRILIVEDNALFRRELRAFLSREPDFQVVGEAGSIREAMRAVGTLLPDLVLTDLTMPDAHGIEAVTEINRCYPDVKILVISLHAENEYKHWCFKAGAVGYVVKDSIHDELCDGIRAALGGKTYLSLNSAGEMVPGFVVGRAAMSPKTAVAPPSAADPRR